MRHWKKCLLGAALALVVAGCDDTSSHYHIPNERTHTFNTGNHGLLSWETPVDVYTPTTYTPDVSPNPDLVPTPTPEPVTLALCGLGLIGVVYRVRCRA